MLNTLKRNYVETDVSAASWDEINLLITVADKCAEAFDHDVQTMRSSFLSSEVNGAYIVADHIAIARATEPTIKEAELRLFPLEKPLAWGDDEPPVDYIVAVILPNGHDTSAIDQITAKIQEQFAKKPVAVDETRKLEKIMRKIVKN